MKTRIDDAVTRYKNDEQQKDEIWVVVEGNDGPYPHGVELDASFRTYQSGPQRGFCIDIPFSEKDKLVAWLENLTQKVREA